MAVMGLLGRQDEDDEDTGGEAGGLVLSGLEPLDEDEDEIVYELDEWGDDDRVILRARLELLGVPHRWEDSTLVISPSDEAWVERILDQVEDELAMRLDAGAQQVAYDLVQWSENDRGLLVDRLHENGIPHSIDGDELFVHEIDEQRADEVIEAILDPDAAPAPDAGNDVMGQLFVAADRLHHAPHDPEGLGMLLDGLAGAVGAPPPYGMDSIWWDGTVSAADDLADAMDTDPLDEDAVREQAAALRTRLRPYV
jgi:hypothetical protein